MIIVGCPKGFVSVRWSPTRAFGWRPGTTRRGGRRRRHVTSRHASMPRHLPRTHAADWKLSFLSSCVCPSPSLRFPFFPFQPPQASKTPHVKQKLFRLLIIVIVLVVGKNIYIYFFLSMSGMSLLSAFSTMTFNINQRQVITLYKLKMMEI